MSRKIQYYHPVKDLIPIEYRKAMLEIWEKEKLADSYDQSKLVDMASETLGFSGYSPEKIQQITLGLHSGTSAYNFHTINTNNKFHNHPIVSMCEEIVSMYEGSSWTFLHSPDDSVKFKPHVDPTFNRYCCITFPLSPDYSEYRHTNFYEDVDPESYLFSVNYGALRSPVLLNLRKFHGVGWELPTESLNFQISFKEPYSDVRKRLEKRKLLSTPV